MQVVPTLRECVAGYKLEVKINWAGVIFGNMSLKSSDLLEGVPTQSSNV